MAGDIDLFNQTIRELYQLADRRAAYMNSIKGLLYFIKQKKEKDNL